MPTERKNVNLFDGNKLVVDLPDAPLVRRELADIGSQPEPGETVKDLGLTSFTLCNLSSAATGLRRDHPDLQAQAKLDRPWATADSDGTGPARSGAPLNGDIPDLDVVLFYLRHQFRGRYDGWTPLMGKDRIIRGIHGLPYIKGGIGNPEPLTEPLAVPGGGNVTGPKIGIIDTRLYPHPRFAGRYVGDPATDLGPQPLSTAGHATFIAGLILQRAPEAQLVVRAVLDDHGTATSSMEVAARMAGFLGTGVSVVNLSWCCFTGDGQSPMVLQRAVERLSAAMVLVAAAGNHGRPDDIEDAGFTPKSPVWPAALPDVVAVGADDATGTGAFFSPHVPWIDLMAPGFQVASTFLPGMVTIAHLDSSGQLTEGKEEQFGEGYALWSGTSFAAANVTGEIAARMQRHQIGAREALDQLLHPHGPAGGDIRPHPLQ